MMDNFVYVVIRIPKSGSTSLANMVGETLSNATVYEMPLDPAAYLGRSLLERWRFTRSRLQNLHRRYGTFSMPTAWQRVAMRVRPGDVITGHIRFGDPILPSLTQRYITLLRDPVARTLSAYNYSRLNFQSRPAWRQYYRLGPDRAAGRYDFSGYLSYLDEHRALYGDLTWRFVCGDTVVDDPLTFVRDRYFHIGTIERLEPFLRGLGEKLGVPVAMRRDNVTAHREATALKAADRPVFERVFSRDIAIYDAVRALDG